MSIIIRYTGSEDIGYLGLIHSKSLQIAFKGIIEDNILECNFSVEKRIEGFRKELENKRPNNIIIFDNDIPIGLMSFGESRYVKVDESCTEIWRIYLLPEFWGKGFGKQLMTWGINEISKKGYKKIILWVLDNNLSARKFYEKFGFKHDGSSRYIKVGKKLLEYKYIKEIQ